MSTNLQKASVSVLVSRSLPGVTNNTKYNFDISAFAWDQIQNSPYFCPLMVESVTDNLGSFAACFPAKRKAFIHNYLSGSTAATADADPKITWKAIDERTGIVLDLTKKFPKIIPGLIQPSDQASYPKTYNGPIWNDAKLEVDAHTDDHATVANFNKQFFGAPPDQTNDTTTPATIVKKEISFINQTVALDGMWFGVESDAFMTEKNTPFWVTLKREYAPASKENETFIVIQIGIGSGTDAYDIYLSNNKKPRIVDYGTQGRQGSGSSSQNPNAPEFDVDLSKIFGHEKDIEIGVMTITGRLVVWVNKVPMVYTRVIRGDADAGKILEAKIDTGKIRIYASNAKYAINVSPMVFAFDSLLALPVPTIPPENSATGSSSTVSYAGVHDDGSFGGSVAMLPKRNSNGSQPIWGVDCHSFSDTGGGGSPSGFGFHQKGSIEFKSAGSLGVSNLPDIDFYVLEMMPSSTKIAGLDLPNGGCPYFIRLQGGATVQGWSGSGASDVSKDVLSISYSAQAPDYFHFKASATVSLYNPNGKWNAFKDKQSGIQIGMGWGSSTKIFTGIVVSATSSMTAGKETIDLQCEDYMYILKNTPILNSPFYDGMYGYAAVQDLAQRCGIMSISVDWDSAEDYFLPSSYALSKPVMRFEQRDMIFECMVNKIVQRFEAFVYFDEAGGFHIKKLPGGLFSAGSGDTGGIAFSSDPETASAELLVLDKEDIEYDFNSTVNAISVYSADRDTRNPIVYGFHSSNNVIAFRKIALIDEASLGDLDTAKKWAKDLGNRIFYPIRRINFKTAKSAGITPLQFMSVDDIEFRLMNLNMRYTAESNDITCEYSGEWLGGK